LFTVCDDIVGKRFAAFNDCRYFVQAYCANVERIVWFDFRSVLRGNQEFVSAFAALSFYTLGAIFTLNDLSVAKAKNGSHKFTVASHAMEKIVGFLDQSHFGSFGEMHHLGSRQSVRSSFAKTNPTNTVSDSFGCCTIAVSSPAYINKKTGGVTLIPRRTALLSLAAVSQRNAEAHRSVAWIWLC
jgi:hypothetical protein